MGRRARMSHKTKINGAAALVWFCPFETGPHYVALTGRELTRVLGLEGPETTPLLFT